MPRISINKPLENALRIESLEDRLLLTALAAVHVERPSAANTVVGALRAAAAPALTTITSFSNDGTFDRVPLEFAPGQTPTIRSRPAAVVTRPLNPSPNSGILQPPALLGATKTVQLSIGDATGNAASPLGVNIGAMTSYAQGNAINNLITQGGGFELANGRIIVHVTGAASTINQIVIDGDWEWSRLGYALAKGQTLVGSTGGNKTGAWIIADMRAQLDASGNPTGNMLITVQGNFQKLPVAADSFFVQLNNIGIQKLADSIHISGLANVTRDLSTAHGGSASALITLGAPDSQNSAQLSYYFGADDTAGRNVLQLGHVYQLAFWAKTATAATATLGLYQGNNGGSTTVALLADNQWHQYLLDVSATNAVVYQNGTASIQISGTNTAVNMDDVSLIDLTDQIAPGNPLSKEVVDLVKQYGFSDLRFWHPDLRFASLDDLIGKPQDRPMITELFEDYDPQFGLPEMLALAKATNTTAWITLPTTWTAQEIHNLMEYLGGDASTVYGAKRVADGHPGSWFADLKGIKFEAGNESWNGTFAPNSYTPFEPYFERAEDMFHDFKTDSLYAANAGKLELIVNGWQWVPWYTEQAIAHVTDADAVDISAYTSGPTTDMPIDQLLGGVLTQQMQENPGILPTSIFGKKVYVYEEAPGELRGTVSAATESAYATSLGAGLATIRNAMQLERDYGIGTQNLFTMFQRGNDLPNGYALGHYGLFTDLTTAQTNPRPLALAAQLLNNASGTILSTSLTYGWSVDSLSTIAAAKTTPAADAMVTFDGSNLVVTFFNNTVADMQNTDFHFSLPAVLNGKPVTADWSKAAFAILNGTSISANNETSAAVGISAGQYTHDDRDVYAALPGHSMGSLIIPMVF